MLYLTLESDVKDYSLNNRWTFTNSGTLGTKGWLSCWCCWTSWYINLGTSATSYLRTSSNKFTISMLVYIDGYNSSNSRLFEFAVQNTIWINMYHKSSWYLWCSPMATWIDTTTSIWLQEWVHIVLTNDNGAWKLYKNWTEIWALSWASNNWFGIWPYSYQNWCYIAASRDHTSWESLNWWLREFINENVCWSATDVSNYYTWIKNKLWI